MQFREATLDDTKEIVELINIAYRGEDGWSTENSLVSGDRTTKNEVIRYLYNPKSHLFVLADSLVKAVICVEEQEEVAYIGFFAVHPSLQGQGVGKALLKKAEDFSVNTLGINYFVMSVLLDRIELIDFYVRQGYVRTNKLEDYPEDLNVGTPKRKLKVISLVKKV